MQPALTVAGNSTVGLGLCGAAKRRLSECSLNAAPNTIKHLWLWCSQYKCTWTQRKVITKGNILMFLFSSCHKGLSGFLHSLSVVHIQMNCSDESNSLAKLRQD